MPIAIVGVLHKSLTVVLSLSQDQVLLVQYQGNILPIGGCAHLYLRPNMDFPHFWRILFKEKSFPQASSIN